jgi:hypothetical protein
MFFSKKKNKLIKIFTITGIERRSLQIITKKYFSIGIRILSKAIPVLE